VPGGRQVWAMFLDDFSRHPWTPCGEHGMNC